MVAAAIFFVGAILMGVAWNFAFLMFGRFIAGIGVGFAMMIAPVYTTEVAPAAYHGFLSFFPEVSINIGILLGYVSNYFLSKLKLDLGWRLMLGIGVVPAVLLGFWVLKMPESPRWLVLQGRLKDPKDVLDKISETREESEQQLHDIKKAAGILENCSNDKVTVPKKNHRKGVWKELFIHPTPPVRRIFLSALAIHFFQQASGIDSVVLYSPGSSRKPDPRQERQPRRHCCGRICQDRVHSCRNILPGRVWSPASLPDKHQRHDRLPSRPWRRANRHRSYMSVAIVAWLFCFFGLPETRGKSLEEIGMLFGMKPEEVDKEVEMPAEPKDLPTEPKDVQPESKEEGR